MLGNVGGTVAAMWECIGPMRNVHWNVGIGERVASGVISVGALELDSVLRCEGSFRRPYRPDLAYEEALDGLSPRPIIAVEVLVPGAVRLADLVPE